MLLDLIFPAFDLQLFPEAPSSELTSLMVGKETTFATAATPTATHIPDSVMFTATNETLERPGATKAVGQNDEPVGMFIGKFDLSVESDPDNLGTWLLLAIGAEAVAAASGNPSLSSGSTTITTAVAAGATAFVLTSATGFATGNGCRLDAGLPTQEDVLMTTVTGVNVVCPALRFAHAASATVTACVLAQAHTFTLASPRLSATIQHNRNIDAINYLGCKVTKLSLSMTPKQPMQLKVSGAYANEAYVSSPVSPSYSVIDPFTFQQQLNTITINGVAADATVMQFTVDIDTGVVTDYPRFGNGRIPYIFPENKTVVSLKTSLAFETVTQRNNFWGNQAATGPQNYVPSLPLSILMNSPDTINAGSAGTGLYYSLLLTFGKAKPVSAPVAAKAKSYLTQDVTWKIYMATRGANNDITAVLTNGSSSNSL